MTIRAHGGVRYISPKIACLREGVNNREVTGAGHLCEYYYNGEYGLGALAVQFQDTELILLCPSFFRRDP